MTQYLHEKLVQLTAEVQFLPSASRLLAYPFPVVFVKDTSENKSKYMDTDKERNVLSICLWGQFHKRN